MFASNVCVAPVLTASRAKPHERRVVLALLCSGTFHAIAAAVAATLLTYPAVLLPVRAPDVLNATLQVPLRLPPQLEISPRRDELAMMVPLLAPAPTLPLSAPTTTARTTPPSPRPPIASTDPNGSVTMGMLDDPQVLGAAIARNLAGRYGARADRTPRLIGSLIIPYPAEARQARASARISAVLDIDERGRITHMTLVPDNRWFSSAVTEVLKDARFTPAEIASQPVPYWAIVEFVFAIAPGPAA